MTPIMTPTEASEEAVRRIRTLEENGSDVLDLGDLPLGELPREITQLKGLRVLILGNCVFDRERDALRVAQKRLATPRPLKTLNGLERLEELRHLDLSRLTFLCSLGEIASLTSLSSLKLNRCTGLKSLPELTKLTSLTSLDLGGCSGLESLPELGSLASLTSLSLSGCTGLETLHELQELTSLTSLDLAGWASLTALPALSRPSLLTSLNLSGCTGLKALPDLGSLTSLTSLTLSGCTGLQSLPELAALTSLTSLSLSGCTALRTLPKLEELTSLTSLDLSGWTSLTGFPKLRKPTLLTSLNLSGCTGLKSLPHLETLTSLRSLQARGCTGLKSLPGLGKLTSLTSLQLGGCTGLQSLPELGTLTALRSLNLNGCTALESLRELGNLTSLTSLGLSGCTKLKDIPGIERMTALNTLDLRGSTALEELPGLRKATSLKVLLLGGCTGLKRLPDMGELTSLESLNLSGWTDLTALPKLAMPTSLTSLDLTGCTSFRVTPELATLTALRVLGLESCGKLGSLAPLKPLIDHLSRLALFGSSFSDLPVELCGSRGGENVLGAVRAHLKALDEQGSQVDRECKLLLLGDGRVGKTSLAKLLLGEPHDPEESSTHGIRLWTWAPKLRLEGDSERAPVRINVWDFGGQDLYHNTHRLFVSSRAVFVLVRDVLGCLEPTSDASVAYVDKRRPLSYWLDQIHSLHRDPQILIVRNKTDLDDRVGPQVPDWRCEVPAKYRHFPSVELSASGRFLADIRALKEELARAVARELGPAGRRTFGKGRWRVKEAIRKLQVENDRLIRQGEAPSRPVLSIDDYRALVGALCAGTADAQDPGHLLRYLHDTGVIYHRYGLFHDSVIVEQRWAIDGIYSLFNRDSCHDRLLQTRGRFRRSQLHAWQWEKCNYTEEQEHLFLSFMRSCRICFRLLKATESAHGEPTYVAPYYLPDRALIEDEVALLLEPFDREPVISGTVAHEFLGESIMGGFLYKLGDLFSRSALLWKNGAAFLARGGSVAATVDWMPLGKQSFGGRLRICVFGDPVPAPNLFMAIRLTFQFQPSFPEDARFVVEANADIKARREELESRRVGVDLEPPPRLEAVGSRIAISRATDDDEDRGIATLPRLLYEELERRRADGAPYGVLIDEGQHRYSRIRPLMDELAASDFVFVFLSRRYLHSKYCLYELMRLFEAGSAGEFNKERIKMLRYPSARFADGSVDQDKLEESWVKDAEVFEARLRLRDFRPLLYPALAQARDECHPWYEFVIDAGRRLAFTSALRDTIYEELDTPPRYPPSEQEIACLRTRVQKWANEAEQRLSRG